MYFDRNCNGEVGCTTIVLSLFSKLVKMEILFPLLSFNEIWFPAVVRLILVENDNLIVGDVFKL